MNYDSPFNIYFGEQPKCFIPRNEQFDEIVSTFSSPDPRSKVFVITGPRGCGKTVLLSQIKKHLDDERDWITIDLNPFLDMHQQLASSLYSEGKMKHLFLKASFSISLQGLSFSLSGESPINDVTAIIKTMLKHLKKSGKRVLVTIDDVSSSNNMKAFVQTYQSLIREQYDIFLLLSGLYENVSDIYNDKKLTFLLRAPKIYLPKLNLRDIAYSYQKYLSLDQEQALKIAKVTNGYAYGYQLLGDLLYRAKKSEIDDDILADFDAALEDNVYARTWSSLSKSQQAIAFALAESKDGSTKEIIEVTGFKPASFQVFRKRLAYAGVIDISEHGKISFLLPRFKEFVLFQKMLSE